LFGSLTSHQQGQESSSANRFLVSGAWLISFRLIFCCPH
jgi:hypothetical protein